MKPFCSGSRADVALLRSLQGRELTTDEINPFYFREPVAPLVAMRKEGRKISLAEVLERIQDVERRSERLVIEGTGGVLVPLSEGFAVADLIGELGCWVIVASRNQLGTLNHTLLAVNTLQYKGIGPIKVVLMDQRRVDVSGHSNQRILNELLFPLKVSRLPFLGPRALFRACFQKNYGKIKKKLARLLS